MERAQAGGLFRRGGRVADKQRCAERNRPSLRLCFTQAEGGPVGGWAHRQRVGGRQAAAAGARRPASAEADHPRPDRPYGASLEKYSSLSSRARVIEANFSWASWLCAGLTSPISATPDP